MMDRLLQAILNTNWPVPAALEWLATDGDTPSLPELGPHSTMLSEPITPYAFQAFVLNFVRDQAEYILSAAEKKPTPSRGAPLQALGQQYSAENVVEDGLAGSRAALLRSLDGVARRLDPGAVDDSNFPALGAASSKLPPAFHARLQAAPATALCVAPKAAAVPKPSGGGEGDNSNRQQRRRIQPTSVAAVEVSRDFVAVPVSEPSSTVATAPSGAFATVVTAASAARAADRLAGFSLSATQVAAASIDQQGKAAWGKAAASHGALSPQQKPAPARRRMMPQAASPAPVHTSTAPCETPPRSTTVNSFVDDAREASPGALTPAPSAALVVTPLSSQAHSLAALHAGIVRSAADISLCDEVDLLLSLLTVPLVAAVDPALAASRALGVLFPCGATAQQYAAAVMQQAGSLLKGLGPQLLEDIAAAAAPLAAVSSAVAPPADLMQSPSFLSSSSVSATAVMKELADAATAAEAALRSRQLRTEKAFNKITGSSSVFGLAAFTFDGNKNRTVEEQRRLSNREACRDAWFALLRDIAAQASSFGGRKHRSGGSIGSVSTFSLASGVPDGRGGPGGSREPETDGAILARLQARASALLRSLRLDNYGAFAELVAAAVVQAAATGEALMDEELTRLAKRDVSRFHSLNRRMQGHMERGSGGGGARRGGAAAPRFPPDGGAGTVSIGFASNGNLASSSSGGGGGGGGMTSPYKQQRPGSRDGRKGVVGSGGGGGAAAAALAAATEEAAAAAARIMAEFPRALRIYVLFLEAADSHRLNCHLMRAMTARLKALAAPPSPGGSEGTAGQPLGEKAITVNALAAFLGYLAFTKGGCGAGAGIFAVESSGEGTDAPTFDASHPIDVLTALSVASGAGGAVSLLRTVPWAARYLRFLRWDPDARAAPYFSATLRMLSALRCAPELSPAHPSFGPAAFCLRALLDDFCAAMALTPTEMGVRRKNSDSSAAGDAVGWGLAVADPCVDSRYVEQCCPSLAHARHLFQPKTGGDGSGVAATDALGGTPMTGGAKTRVPKKIRPTAPLDTTAAPAPAPRPGSAVDRMSSAAGSADPVKLRLQRAFLEQYSTQDHRVKLKDVVEYASDVIACNAAEAAVAAVAPGEVEAAAVEISAAIAVKSPLERPLEEVELRKAALAAAEAAICSATKAVVERSFAATQGPIKTAAARVALGLTPSDLGEAVISTAAAIIVEAAEAACSDRIPTLAAVAVRQALLRHGNSAVTESLREVKRVAAAAASAESCMARGRSK